jgi:hypothetical protein
MAMNKIGQMMILKIMLAIVVLIIAMAWITPIKENINIGMNSSANLNCSSNSLDYSSTATCVVMEFTIFYFIGALISVGMAFLAGKKNMSGVISSITIFVIIVVLINPLKELIVYFRDADHLACLTTTSVPEKLLCIVVDAWLFWFIAVVIAGALSYIFAKEVLPSQ